MQNPHITNSLSEGEALRLSVMSVCKNTYTVFYFYPRYCFMWNDPATIIISAGHGQTTKRWIGQMMLNFSFDLLLPSLYIQSIQKAGLFFTDRSVNVHRDKTIAAELRLGRCMYILVQPSLITMAHNLFFINNSEFLQMYITVLQTFATTVKNVQFTLHVGPKPTFHKFLL